LALFTKSALDEVNREFHGVVNIA
jgi:CRP-like cAMP-binding protein